MSARRDCGYRRPFNDTTLFFHPQPWFYSYSISLYLLHEELSALRHRVLRRRHSVPNRPLALKDLVVVAASVCPHNQTSQKYSWES